MPPLHVHSIRLDQFRLSHCATHSERCARFDSPTVSGVFNFDSHSLNYKQIRSTLETFDTQLRHFETVDEETTLVHVSICA